MSDPPDDFAINLRFVGQPLRRLKSEVASLRDEEQR